MEIKRNNIKQHSVFLKNCTIFVPTNKINNMTNQTKPNKSLTQKVFIQSLAPTVTRDEAWDMFVTEHGASFTRRGDFNNLFKLNLNGELPIVNAIAVSNSNSNSTTVQNYAQVNRAASFEPTEVKVDKMSDLKSEINPDFLIPLKTDTCFDELVSKRLGVMPGTVTMITGESGAGKTTISTNIAEFIKISNPGKTAGFISGEMDKLDWYEECHDNKNLMDLDTVFLLEYLDAPDFMSILRKSLEMWDFCVVDSFEAILDQIKETTGLSSKKAEAEFIKMLRLIAMEKGVAFFVIQQFTKGGTYVGSTKIKHLTTAMIFVMFDENKHRYITWEKNRRNGSTVNKKLYFTKNKISGLIEFDTNRFENDKVMQDFKETNDATLLEENNIFQSILDGNGDGSEFTESLGGVFEFGTNVVAEENLAAVA